MQMGAEGQRGIGSAASRFTAAIDERSIRRLRSSARGGRSARALGRSGARQRDGNLLLVDLHHAVEGATAPRSGVAPEEPVLALLQRQLPLDLGRRAAGRKLALLG